MIFMGTYTLPGNKTDEWVKCSAGAAANPLPACIKKWQTFFCSDCNGYKGYNLIFTQKGTGDEALIEISKVMFPFCQIEGSSWTLEPLMGSTDAFIVLGEK